MLFITLAEPRMMNGGQVGGGKGPQREDGARWRGAETLLGGGGGLKFGLGDASFVGRC